MDQKTHYQTDAHGVYTGPIECPPNPEEEGAWWVPFGAYEDAPPALEANQAATRVDVHSPWVVVPDFRGLTYWLADRTKVTITEVGVIPPAGHLLADPGPTPAQRLAMLKRDAKVALQEGDQVAARCVKFAVQYPEAWRIRDAALVAIVNLPEGSDPDAVIWPDDAPYPAGTDWPAVA